MPADDKITSLKGVGAKRAELLGSLGIFTVRDLLYHLPRRYLDFTSPKAIKDAVPGETALIKCRAYKKRSPDIIRRNMKIYRIIFTDGESDITAVIYNSQYLYNSIKEDCDYCLYGRVTRKPCQPRNILAHSFKRFVGG